MSRLETETRKCIDDYYSSKITILEREKSRFKDKYTEIKIEEFKNDNITKQIEKLFDELRKKYKGHDIRTECKLYTGWGSEFPYYEEKEYKELSKKVNDLTLEKRRLILTLETNSKSSNEYKKAIKDFIKTMEKETKANENKND